ncbi:MAG: ScpA family protein [Candidatus Gastranaerophilaceae bacterium]
MNNTAQTIENKRIISTDISVRQENSVNMSDDINMFNLVLNTKTHSAVEFDGIEILVEMVKKNKLDPWNIDIVDITDKYLHQLVELKSNNLKLTGRTLLFAAVLLRLKSNILEGIDFFYEEDQILNEFEEDYDDPDFEEPLNRNNVVSLEDVIQRRTSVRLNKQRIVTLKDLIKQLKFYEEIERKRSLKNAHERAKRRARSYENFTAEDIIDIAHDEFIEDSVDILHTTLIKLFETDEKIDFKELYHTGMDKITAYIALLFLSARSRIELVQDEFYSDLYIVREKEV